MVDTAVPTSEFVPNVAKGRTGSGGAVVEIEIGGAMCVSHYHTGYRVGVSW
jgi:hypothetical protein